MNKNEIAFLNYSMERLRKYEMGNELNLEHIMFFKNLANTLQTVVRENIALTTFIELQAKNALKVIETGV